jgi:hypothetical protein
MQDEDGQREIATMSARLRLMSGIAILILLGFWIGEIVQARAIDYWEYGPVESRLPFSTMPPLLIVTTALLRLTELAPVIGALVTLRSLLREWSEGAIFTVSTALHVRKIGVWVIVLAIVQLASSAVLGPLAHAADAIPSFRIHLNLNLAALAVGITVLLLGRIMLVGARLQDQADRTI